MSSLIAKKQWGRPPTLNKSQSAKLIQILRSFDPTQFGLPNKLWNRSSIVHVVKSEMKIEMHTEAVSRFLKKHNFTFHKPARRAYQQDKESVAEWVSKTFPKIKSRAKKKEQACILGMKADSSFVTQTEKVGRRRVKRGS
jgi:transposase